ncbi:expressed unknown protein [Seminavis robusta]|uniref:Uncharacterized protein n=1 Tax=Seminavis robusta TaxID=568900 RepID=A0A9N8D7Y2_9STRA|nr:expressed unknown protein [Seminavis robusta]|eukprot:Sro31_g020060.1 n/a (169) ;mRNA; r:20377-20883
MPNHLGPFPVTRSEVFRSKKDSTFEIDLGQGQQIVVKTRKDWVTVKMIKMKQRGFKNSRGMMGDFTTGAMLARDGKTVLKDPNAFGQEWQVRQDDPQLFGTVLSPQYPEQCIMPSLPSSTGRRLGESSVSEDEAKLACGSLQGQSYANCVFDVVHSGDLEIAEFYEQF